MQDQCIFEVILKNTSLSPCDFLFLLKKLSIATISYLWWVVYRIKSQILVKDLSPALNMRHKTKNLVRYFYFIVPRLLTYIKPVAYKFNITFCTSSPFEYLYQYSVIASLTVTINESHLKLHPRNNRLLPIFFFVFYENLFPVRKMKSRLANTSWWEKNNTQTDLNKRKKN